MSSLHQPAATYLVRTRDQIIDAADAEARSTRFGNWTLHRRRGVLVFEPERYAVTLRGCRTQAGVIRWLAQLADKDRIGSGDLGDFVRALHTAIGLRDLR
jgi:hypothetical protein